MKIRNHLFALAAVSMSLVTAYSALSNEEWTIPSSVKGITVANTHRLARTADKSEVIRGSAPLGKAAELKKYGITDVLIFKNPSKKTSPTEVDQEVQELKEVGYSSSRIKHIPFRWKQYESFQVACEQSVDALRKLVQVYNTAGRKVFFHCTVGQDRTGALAGLFRMLVQDWSVQRAFDDELCAYGYEAGNPDKPEKVVNDIRAELTPIFFKVAYLIKSGKLTMDDLDKSVCADEETIDAAIEDDETFAYRECEPAQE